MDKQEMKSQSRDNLHEIWEKYNVNDFIDAKDNQGDWRVGFIVQKNQSNKTFKVRFDGWASKYDETYFFNSPKLSNFRAIVIGYTGQKKNPGTRNSWKFNQKNHSEKVKIFQNFMRNKNKNAWQINQWLRGHNYLYVDFLMTQKYENKQQFNAVMEYFIANVKMVISYLRQLDPEFKQYYRAQEIPEQSHLLDGESAYAHAYYQVMDTLYIISANYSRFEKFFIDNKMLIKNYLQDEQDTLDKCFQRRIQKEVSNEGGYQILNQLIDVKLKNTKCVIPFLFLKSLTLLYKGLSNNWPIEERSEYFLKLVEITKQNTRKIDDKYLKYITKNNVSQLLQTLKNIFQDTEHQSTIRIWSVYEEIKFYEKMIYCPYFDKKLKGIIGLQQLAEKNKMDPYSNKFVQILKEQKIFDCLFSFDNAEIIRQSVQFCKTLYLNEMFPQKLAYRIWLLREGKHEAALQQIYSLIAFLPIKNKYNNCQFTKQLFQQISKLPKQQWDEDYIKMIKQYSLNAVGEIFHKTHSFSYGLDILYENAVIKKTDFAINSFIELLGKFHKIELINKFINGFFAKIQNNQQSYVYITFLKRIINENENKLSEISQNAPNILIKDLLKNSNDKLQKNTIRYEVLNQILKLTNTEITIQQFMNLWYEYANKPSKKALYNWILIKKYSENFELNEKISANIRKQIFEKAWTNSYNFENISQQQTNIFIQFFKITNMYDNKLKKMNKIIKIENLNLKGFAKVWKAFDTVRNNKIAEHLAQLIVEIYMTPVKNTRQSCVSTLMTHFSEKINEAYKQLDINKIKRWLIIPIKIIQRDQEIFRTTTEKSDRLKEYKVMNATNKEEKSIKFNINGLAYDFKKTVAQKFNIPFKKCKISSKSDTINYQNYFQLLHECFFHTQYFKLQIIDEQPIQIKNLLNNNLEIFFNLLDNPQLEQNVWQIIEQLPVPESFLAKLEKSQKSWDQINNSCIYKQLYIMKVMKYMSHTWWQQFCMNPGLLNLSKKFQRVHSKTKVQREYLKVLCENIQKCLKDIDAQKINFQQINLQTLQLTMLKSMNELFNNYNVEQLNKKSEIDVEIIASMFEIFQFFQRNINVMELIIQKFQEKNILLTNGLLVVRNQAIRKQFAKRLIEIRVNIPNQNISTYIDIIYENIFERVIAYPHSQQTTQYFQYSAELVDRITSKQFKEKLVKKVEYGLLNQQPLQNSQKIPYHLVGFLTLMEKLISYCTEEEKQKLTKFLLQKCLIPHSADANVLCKCKESKTSALQLLQVLIKQDINSVKTLKKLSTLHKNAKWRKLDEWNINCLQKIKSVSGYVGLKNLGCICYINSFLQQIFMIQDFRNLILECQDPLQNEQNEVSINNVLFQVKKMFLNLLLSQKKYYIPHQFCHAFKNYEGESINVTEQMDIDQFSTILFDKLQNQIKGTPYQNVIKDFFGGIFSNEIICKGCPHFSESQQSFLSISLNVKNKKNIHQSFDTMIKGDTLDGDNAYFCQRCNKKVSAIKRGCLKKLPDHLILTLKRFEFDFEIMKKLKVNDYCQFPVELNLKQYSQQYLHRKEKPDKFQDEEIIPDSYYQYTLQGVVIHIGNADSGHYYSLIKQRGDERRWFEFNDTNVRPFDIKKLPEETFGGYMKTMELKERIKNAYMLIYERKKKLIDHSKNIAQNKNWTQSPKCIQIKQQIKEQNSKQKIQNILFSTQYKNFASNLLDNLEKMNRQISKQVLKYTVLVYLTVIIREKDQTQSFKFLVRLHKVLHKYDEVKQWIVAIFTAQNSLMEFFKNNPKKQIKKLLANWIAQLANEVSQKIKISLIDAIIVFFIHQHQNQSELCQLLYYLMSSQEICEYVMKKHIVGILLENLLGNQRPGLNKIEQLKVVVSAEQQIGKQIIIQKPITSEQYKKVKIIQETAYVWGILYALTKLAKQKDKNLRELLTSSQLQLFNLLVQKIYKYLQQAKGKFMINNLCQFLTHLAINDRNVSQKLINNGFDGLKTQKVKRYRQFFILFNKLMKIDDQFTQFRQTKGFEAMVKGLKENQKFTDQCTVIQQWIVKILRKNDQLQQIFRNEQSYHTYLMELPAKKQYVDKQRRKVIHPNIQTPSQEQQEMIAKFHGIRMLKSKKICEQFVKKIVDFYVNLINSNGNQNVSNQWESDECLAEDNLKVGQKIAYLQLSDNCSDRQKMKFVDGQIDEISLRRLEISVNKVKMPPLWQDDDKLTSNKYPFWEYSSDDELPDSENTTTQMEYDQDAIEHVESIN